MEMRELLPDSWAEEHKESCCRAPRPKRGGLITDVTLWTECYASLVAVLAACHPDKTPQFMAYLKTIIHASRNFEGSAWASYDAAYRRQAANRQSYDWAEIDTALYNAAFTGRAKVLPRCRYCLAETHTSIECQFAPSEDLPPPKTPRLLPDEGSTRMRPAGTIELCGLFNRPSGNQCSFRWCRYAHICAKCRRGPHPAADRGK